MKFEIHFISTQKCYLQVTQNSFRDFTGENGFSINTKTLFATLTVLTFSLMLQKQWLEHLSTNHDNGNKLQVVISFFSSTWNFK